MIDLLYRQRFSAARYLLRPFNQAIVNELFHLKKKKRDFSPCFPARAIIIIITICPRLKYIWPCFVYTSLLENLSRSLFFPLF